MLHVVGIVILSLSGDVQDNGYIPTSFELCRIQQVFDRFDKDGGGSLDRTELQPLRHIKICVWWVVSNRIADKTQFET